MSFLPVFALEDQEGRLFKPLAYTKTFAMAGGALLSVTLVPVLMLLFVRGRILPERRNPINRALIWLYRPVIGVVLRCAARRRSLLAVLALAATAWPVGAARQRVHADLNEGTLLYMPVTLPGLSVTKAAELLQTQDRIIKSFPEVASVFGKAGRAATATDPAPIEMFETVINLKPEDEWRPGMTVETLIAEMDQALRLPGVSNAWTMPIKARIDMLSTGIRTPVGVKVFGPDLAEHRAARQARSRRCCARFRARSSAFAERIGGGHYLDIEPDRAALARYGLTVGDVQEAIATALGGETVTTTVEGRERYRVNVRYPRDLRDRPAGDRAQGAGARPAAARWCRSASSPRSGSTQGPPTIRTENAQLVAYVYVDMRDRDIGGYVARGAAGGARTGPASARLPLEWSGQFEYLERAKARLDDRRAGDAAHHLRAALPEFRPARRDADRDAVGALRPGRRRVADGLDAAST